MCSLCPMYATHGHVCSSGNVLQFFWITKATVPPLPLQNGQHKVDHSCSEVFLDLTITKTTTYISSCKGQSFNIIFPIMNFFSRAQSENAFKFQAIAEKQTLNGLEEALNKSNCVYNIYERVPVSIMNSVVLIV
jgi:hypothetical protein